MGYDINIDFNDHVDSYILEYNNRYVCIEDAFFSKHPEPLAYLDSEHIPTKVPNVNFGIKELDIDLPIIYGDEKLFRKGDRLHCGFDIFSSSYFLLTRWEELVIEAKNDLGRVDESSLLAVKHGFHRFPAVNAYCVFLASLLNSIGCPAPDWGYSFRFFSTHDVDWCYLSTWKLLFENLRKLVSKYGNFKKSSRILWRYIYYKLKHINPFDSFDEIMALCESIDTKAHFFFKALEPGESGYTYSIHDTSVRQIIKCILDREHLVGFHPSRNSVDSVGRFLSEYYRLANAIPANILMGRTHGLDSNTNTLEFWERAGIKYNSDCGFQYHYGFRNGCCFPSKVFNPYTRSTLRVYSIPFIGMDSVALRIDICAEDIVSNVVKLIDQVKRYDGWACINWHSNMFNMVEMKDYREVYPSIIRYISSLL
jgi:hypothetical protein